MFRLDVRAWPIRTRIALSIFVFAMAALVIMALGVYVTFRKTLSDNLDDTLRERANQNLGLVELDGPTLRFADSSFSPTTAPGDLDAFARIYSDVGELLGGSSDVPNPAPGEGALVAAALTGAEPVRSIAYGGTSYRVVAQPLLRDGALVGVLVTGIDRESLTEALDVLAAILLVAVPLTGGVLAVVGLVIARRALRPVHELTATARSIAAGDLQQRIVGVQAADEVGELAATFNTMIERLAGTIERERQFTGDAAHELRTPLTAMQAGIDVTLSQERTPQQYRDTLATVREQATRMSRMTRQLLLLARLDSDGTRRAFVPVELQLLVSAVLDDFMSEQPAVRLSTRLECESARIQGDAELLARAFSNVLRNAVAHAGPAVAMSVVLQCHPGCVEVDFADDGPGFPPAMLPHVFRRFHRGDTAGHETGAGLGMALVESITRLHGGSVTAANGSPGAIVRFRFPSDRRSGVF